MDLHCAARVQSEEQGVDTLLRPVDGEPAAGGACCAGRGMGGVVHLRDPSGSGGAAVAVGGEGLQLQMVEETAVVTYLQMFDYFYFRSWTSPQGAASSVARPVKSDRGSVAPISTVHIKYNTKGMGGDDEWYLGSAISAG